LGEVRREPVEAVARHVRDDVEWNPDSDPLHAGDCAGNVVAEIGLGEHDRRLGAAFPGEDEVALESSGVEIADESADEEGDVDVRRQDLLVGAAMLVARRRTHECRTPRQDGLDRCTAARPPFERDPVSDRGQVGHALRVEAQPAGELRGQLAELAEDAVGAAVLDRDATGCEPGSPVRLELFVEVRAPAELGQAECLGEGRQELLLCARACAWSARGECQSAG
jgi:hypothetical protein